MRHFVRQGAEYLLGGVVEAFGVERDLVGLAWAAARRELAGPKVSECAALPLQGDQTVGQRAAEECRVVAVI